uniref:Membrane protein n=1 Tax=uncultured marine bacterium HF10_19P19 TaxID=413067 RepID=A4GID7_9BACT|nr:membrane protein [uncultured marine bacterium HF10_19P19]
MSETVSRKSVIGAGATFTGKLVKASALDIHGEVNADVSTDRLHLHEGARLAGDLDIKLGVFAGEYKGRMRASSVWVMRTARIFGEIEYNALQMDRGAALNCHILHNWVELKDAGIDPLEITEAGFLTDLHDLGPSDKTDSQASDE